MKKLKEIYWENARMINAILGGFDIGLALAGFVAVIIMIMKIL